MPVLVRRDWAMVSLTCAESVSLARCVAFAVRTNSVQARVCPRGHRIPA